MSEREPEGHILESWRANATPWTQAIREQQIESRRLVTNQAIIDAVARRAPRTALDIGCGEGWLARAMADRGIVTIGVDAIPALIDAARRAGPGDFRVATYDAIAHGALAGIRVDVAIANFALLGAESAERLVAAVPELLAPAGAFIIQTVHPLMVTGDLPYQDGWREGSWSLANLDFSDPAPWYFRTVGGWIRLLVGAGFRIVRVDEPLHPGTAKPASLILAALVLPRGAEGQATGTLRGRVVDAVPGNRDNGPPRG